MRSRRALKPCLTPLVAAILAGVAATASATSFTLFGPRPTGSGFEESVAEAISVPPAISLEDAITASVSTAPPGRTSMPDLTWTAKGPPHKLWIGAVSTLAVLGSAYNSFGDGPNHKFHFTNEGFFGQYTYAGGADKASHFVSYYVVARLLADMYTGLNLPPEQALPLAAGVSAFAGFVTELGDGRGKYGFSYEDLLVDTLGAATYLGIAHYGLGDLIGFSVGAVPSPPGVCCQYGSGTNYSELIFSGDLKIAGLGSRAGFNPGPARFLLVSTTYGTKGYAFFPPDVRERQIGFFLGVNFTEILHTVGVPEKTWWGKILYFAFDVIRIPYTQIGYVYDLNHGKWHGPTIGDAFPGGKP